MWERRTWPLPLRTRRFGTAMLARIRPIWNSLRASDLPTLPASSRSRAVADSWPRWETLGASSRATAWSYLRAIWGPGSAWSCGRLEGACSRSSSSSSRVGMSTRPAHRRGKEPYTRSRRPEDPSRLTARRPGPRCRPSWRVGRCFAVRDRDQTPPARGGRFSLIPSRCPISSWRRRKGTSLCLQMSELNQYWDAPGGI